MKLALAAAIALLLLAMPGQAAEHEVRMLNYGKDGGMVFEPAFVLAEPGDTVTFVPGNSGHFVQSYAVPDEAKAWKSTVDERFSVVLEQEGVYLYVCPPHLMMSMLGAIQVGRAGNIEDVKSRAAKLRPKLVMKGERLDAALAQVVGD